MKIIVWNKQDKIDFFWGIIFGIITSALSASLPFIVKIGTDKFSNNQNSQTILFFLGLLGIMFLIGSFAILSSYFSKLFLAKLISRKIAQTRQKLFSNIQEASPEDLQRYDSSSLISRLSLDIFNYSIYLNWAFINVIPSILRLVIFTVMTFIINYNIGFLMILLSLILYVGSFLLSKNSVKHFQLSVENIDQITNITQENISGIRVVKSFNLKRKQLNRFEKINEKIVFHSSQADIKAFEPWPFSLALINATSIFILVLATLLNWFNVGKSVNYGDIVALISYSYLILWSTFELAFLYIYYARSLSSKKRIWELITLEFKNKNDSGKKFESGDIEFKNVSFRYNPHSHDYVIHNANLKFKKGAKIGIIGPTGSGKTSLLYLIARLWNPTSGQIFINGVDIKEINTSSLLENISFAFQNKLLFSGTIAENIRFSNENINDKEIENLLEMCELKKFSDSKKEGINYRIEEAGQNLSGGQKQRMNIARALAKEASIYIFDDSTSALDNITETKILDNLLEQKKNSTIIISSQKVSTIKKMDQIIVLDKGEISAVGTHDFLLKENDIYKEIFRLQNEKEE